MTLNLIGVRFGKLVVQSREANTQHGKRRWLCLCDCGKTKVAITDNLRSGKTQSCGCLVVAGIKQRCCTGYQEITGRYWGAIQRGARSRGLEFSITMEQMWDLFIKQNRQCALTGEQLSFERCKKQDTQTASLDRIDSKKGYTIDNVQWVHRDINNMKWALPQSRFIELCRKVTNHGK